MTYAGWSFPFEKNEGESRIVLDDSNSDYLYTEKTWVVTAVLHPGLEPAGLTYAQWIDQLQHDLESPRRTLTVDFGDGGTLVNVTADTDCKNGPVPKMLAFTQFAGSSSCLLRFQVTAHVRNCDSGGQVLSHRWEDDVDLDGKTFLTVRTRTGRIVIRPGRLVADDFRDVATPPCPEGFRPVRSKYKVAKDGLSLDYTIVHEETAVGIPPGATDADGESRVLADKGIWKFAEVNVRLTGDKAQSKQALVELAILVAMKKLEALSIQKGNGEPGRRKPWQVLSGSISEKLWKNEVSIHLRTLLSQPKRPKKLVSDVKAKVAGWIAGTIISGKLGGAIIDAAESQPGENPVAVNLVPISFETTAYAVPPLGSVPEQSPDVGLRGTAGLALLAAALNDPCLTLLVNGGANELRTGGTPIALAPSTDLVRLPAGASSRTTEVVGQGRGDPIVPPAAVEVVDALPDDLPAEMDGGLYTSYKIWREVLKDTGKIPLVEQRAGGKTRLVHVRGRSTRLVCRWTAERVGEPPEPLPEDLGDNVLPYKTIDSDGSIEDTTADGVTLIFRRSGEYHYAVSDPTVNELIGMSVPPWVADAMGLGAKPIILGGPPSDPGAGAGGQLVGGPG